MANASPSNSGFITNSFSKGDKSTYVDFESTKDKNKSDNAELYYEFKQGNISKDYYLQKSKNLSSDEYEKEFILSANTFLDESIERSNEQLSNAYLEKIKNTGNYTNVNLFSRAASGMIETLLQVPQERDYYCGPSTAKSIISSRSSNPSQKTLAHKDWLETDVWGNTPWWVGGNADGYNPMQYTRNKYQGINYYSICGSSVTASGLKSGDSIKVSRSWDIIKLNIKDGVNGTWNYAKSVFNNIKLDFSSIGKIEKSGLKAFVNNDGKVGSVLKGLIFVDQIDSTLGKFKSPGKIFAKNLTKVTSNFNKIIKTLNIDLKSVVLTTLKVTHEQV